jgi:hypothetical protein
MTFSDPRRYAEGTDLVFRETTLMLRTVGFTAAYRY